MINDKYINSERIRRIIEFHFDKNNEIFSVNNSFSTYDFSYNYFIKVFDHLRDKNENDYHQWIVIGGSIVYSWMPTILNFSKGSEKKSDYNTQLSRAQSALEKIEKKIISQKSTFFDPSLLTDLNIIVSFINNSVVGTSKFLHFSFPNHYPIWDSRVELATRFDINDPMKKLSRSNHRTKSIENYILYLNVIHDIIKNHKPFLEKCFKKSTLSDIRKIEYALFVIGGF